MNDAIARCRKMVEQFPDHELARFSLGKALFDAGEFAQAKSEFEQALSRKPDWMVVQILVGKCDLAAGNRDAARDAFLKALRLAIEQSHEGPREEMEQALSELGQPPR
jgi:tetratricopeptide (TPR) repeat protein